jgi:serine/threonine-protein kinase
MEALILKALEKDPERRYPSASSMLDDVESAEAPVVPRKVLLPRPAPRRRRGALLLVPVLTLLLLLGGAAFASGYVGSPPEGVESALSRINSVETQHGEARAPAPPEPAQETEEPQPSDETPEEAAQPVAQTTATPVDQAAQQALVPVPDVTAYYDYYARQTLADSGFNFVFVRDYREGFAARGVTWATEPAAGELAPEGSTVTVYATPQDLPQRPVF